MNNREIIIDQVCILNRENISKKDCPKSIYYLDTGNITRNKISELVLLGGGFNEYPSRAQRRVKDKTIIYSTVRPNQRHFGILVSPADNLIVSTGFTTLDVTDREIDPLYLYYSLTRDEITAYLQTIGENSVSAYPSINPSDIGCLKLVVPKRLSDQRRIAAVLSAFDSKIEINNRINEELEGMAKLLYDFWFVQFDFPITATQAAAMGNLDLEGKPYRASGGPMTYNETLKREIPADWHDGRATEIFVVNPSLPLRVGTVAGHFDMDALPTSGFMTKGLQAKPFNGGAKFSNGDVVVARITPCLENGKTALITQLDDDQVGFGSTEFIVLRGKTRSLSAFGSCLARSDYFRKFAILNMTGTSGRKRIEAPVLSTIPLPIPPPKLLTSFEQICDPMFKAMTENAKQNQLLTELRDWLLPMLMNGQVKINP